VRYILKRQARTPGEEFHYSDDGVHLLSPILVHATGLSVLAYARTHLFDRLGIPTTPAAQPVADQAYLGEYERAGFAWSVDPQGFHSAASASTKSLRLDVGLATPILDTLPAKSHQPHQSHGLESLI
jgi:CubicO group peptidase (beta-lactamase class C family)